MTDLTSLWLPILLSSVIVFVLSSIITSSPGPGSASPDQLSGVVHWLSPASPVHVTLDKSNRDSSISAAASQSLALNTSIPPLLTLSTRSSPCTS